MSLPYVNLILPILKGLGKFLKNIFLGHFFMKIGAKKQQLRNYEVEEENLKDVKKISRNVDGMSDAALRQLLYDCTKKLPKDEEK